MIIDCQGGLCMYCGVDLRRLNRSQRHIDHMDPVERGGPDVEENMQALCGRCNSRKGVQTDGEFRERYRELLGGLRPGQPPSSRIPQSRFVAVSNSTRQLASTKAARKVVFTTPTEKIFSASLVAGTALGFIWLVVLSSILDGVRWEGEIAFFGGFVVFCVTWAGSMWRARVTGILDAEYVDKGVLVGSARRRG